MTGPSQTSISFKKYGDKPKVGPSLHPPAFLRKQEGGAAVYYLKGEHNRAYDDAFRTQEAI